jgi:hypothetical protein
MAAATSRNTDAVRSVQREARCGLLSRERPALHVGSCGPPRTCCRFMPTLTRSTSLERISALAGPSTATHTSLQKGHAIVTSVPLLLWAKATKQLTILYLRLLQVPFPLQTSLQWPRKTCRCAGFPAGDGALCSTLATHSQARKVPSPRPSRAPEQIVCSLQL